MSQHKDRPRCAGRPLGTRRRIVASLVNVEGISYALPDVDERMDDPVERALLLDTLRATEAVPALLGTGPHLIATAVRSAEH